MIFGASDGPRDPSLNELVATAEQVRSLDSEAMAWGVQGLVLMELAGAAAARAIRLRLGDRPGKAVILCGTGNNGGDGYVVARHLADQGFAIRTLALGAPRPGSDAEKNHTIWQRLLAHDAASGSPRHEHRLAERGATARMRHFLGHANVIVDALFGTGLARPLDGAAQDLVEAANTTEHGLKVALDIASGLDATTGQVLGVAFRADLTLTFGVLKRGLLLGEGPSLSGELEVVSIGWPRPAIDAVPTTLRRLTEGAMRRLVPTREAHGHKGTFGHVLVLGGTRGMEGAAILAARGAARSGVGLTTWVAPGGETTAPLEVERPPELMRTAFGGAVPGRPDVLVCGPGLGHTEEARSILEAVLADPRPLVLDADGLNLLAERPELIDRSGWVLTPHPLEAARLLGTTAAQVQADRVTAATTLAETRRAVVVLKGAQTLVAAPDHPTVLLDLAEPTLATGGSGDVLAGLIGGLIAQGSDPFEAACLGVWVHGHAGRDAGLGQGQRGVLASEIADRIPTVLHLLA